MRLRRIALLLLGCLAAAGASVDASAEDARGTAAKPRPDVHTENKGHTAAKKEEGSGDGNVSRKDVDREKERGGKEKRKHKHVSTSADAVKAMQKLWDDVKTIHEAKAHTIEFYTDVKAKFLEELHADVDAMELYHDVKAMDVSATMHKLHELQKNITADIAKKRRVARRLRIRAKRLTRRMINLSRQLWKDVRTLPNLIWREMWSALPALLPWSKVGPDFSALTKRLKVVKKRARQFYPFAKRLAVIEVTEAYDNAQLFVMDKITEQSLKTMDTVHMIAADLKEWVLKRVSDAYRITDRALILALKPVRWTRSATSFLQLAATRPRGALDALRKGYNQTRAQAAQARKDVDRYLKEKVFKCNRNESEEIDHKCNQHEDVDEDVNQYYYEGGDAETENECDNTNAGDLGFAYALLVVAKHGYCDDVQDRAGLEILFVSLLTTVAAWLSMRTFAPHLVPKAYALARKRIVAPLLALVPPVTGICLVFAGVDFYYLHQMIRAFDMLAMPVMREGTRELLQLEQETADKLGHEYKEFRDALKTFAGILLKASRRSLVVGAKAARQALGVVADLWNVRKLRVYSVLHAAALAVVVCLLFGPLRPALQSLEAWGLAHWSSSRPEKKLGMDIENKLIQDAEHGGDPLRDIVNIVKRYVKKNFGDDPVKVAWALVATIEGKWQYAVSLIGLVAVCLGLALGIKMTLTGILRAYSAKSYAKLEEERELFWTMVKKLKADLHELFRSQIIEHFKTVASEITDAYHKVAHKVFALPLSLAKSLDVDKLTDIVKSIHHGAMAALATVLSTYAANISIAADVSDTLYKVCITILQPRIDILTDKAEKTKAGSGKALEGHITGFLKGAIMSGALTFTVNHPKLMRSFWSSIVGADMFLSWAWRNPFYARCSLAMLGVYLQSKSYAGDEPGAPGPFRQPAAYVRMVRSYIRSHSLSV